MMMMKAKHAVTWCAIEGLLSGVWS